MKDSLLQKLEHLRARSQELTGLLSNEGVWKDQTVFRELSREQSELRVVVECFESYLWNRRAIEEARRMLDEEDAGLRELSLIHI